MVDNVRKVVEVLLALVNQSALQNTECLHLQVLKSASIKTVSSGQCKRVGHHWEMSVRKVPLYTQLRYIQVEA